MTSELSTSHLETTSLAFSFDSSFEGKAGSASMFIAYYFIASHWIIWMGGQLHVCERKSTEEVMEVDKWDRVMSIIDSKLLGEATVHTQRLPSLPSNLSCVFSLWRNLELPLIIVDNDENNCWSNARPLFSYVVLVCGSWIFF